MEIAELFLHDFHDPAVQIFTLRRTILQCLLDLLGLAIEPFGHILHADCVQILGRHAEVMHSSIHVGPLVRSQARSIVRPRTPAGFSSAALLFATFRLLPPYRPLALLVGLARRCACTIPRSCAASRSAASGCLPATRQSAARSFPVAVS